MKEPIISGLSGVSKSIIDDLEKWLKNIKGSKLPSRYNCPFTHRGNYLCGKSNKNCDKLFDNLDFKCPCSAYGGKATIRAFKIICDVWPEYNK